MQQLAMISPSDDATRSVLEPLRPGETAIAFRDGLTGLYNYRLLEDLLETRWSELRALTDRFAIVILDLDLFKDVNDRYGHLAGDEVLRETGNILLRTFRAGDFVFRYGGDEFVVLLPGADSEEAAALGERARTAMLEAEFFAPEEVERIEIPVSFSIGVAAWPGDGESGKVVLARADERLYAEKQALKRKVARRRLAISGGAIGLLAALAVAIAVWFSGRAPAPAPLQAPASASPAEAAPPSPGEEQLLLARIAELQQEIDRLTKAREVQKAPDAKKSGDEIAALQARVRELSERLDTKQAAVPAPAVEAPRAAPERSLPEPPAGEAEPRATTPPSAGAPARAAAPVVTMPRLLEPVIPKYPALALSRRMETSIEFTVLVDDGGRVVAAYPTDSPRGLGFDEAARAAVMSSRWKPGTRDGVPASMETRLVVHFRIRN